MTKVKRAWQLIEDLFKSQATDVLEWEYIELEHIFSLLVYSSFVGLPAPPLQVTLELMPYLENHLILMMDKVDTAEGPLSDLFSQLNIG